MTERLLYRVHEAAEALGQSRSKTYEMIYSGELPAVKIRGSWRVPVGELERWVKEQTGNAATLALQAAGRRGDDGIPRSISRGL